MKRRLTSLYGDCAADDCVHGDCCGHISEGSVVQWVDIRGLWAPLLMMQMVEFCFGLWLWMTYSQGRSSLPRGCWSLSLASSCWWRIAREWKTEKKSCLFTAYTPPTLPPCGLDLWQRDAMSHIFRDHLCLLILPLTICCYLSYLLCFLHFLSVVTKTDFTTCWRTY